MFFQLEKINLLKNIIDIIKPFESTCFTFPAEPAEKL